MQANKAFGPLTDEQKRWRVIYPAYLNSNLKISQGRRVPLDKCVEDPLPGEILEVCKFLQFPTVVEVPPSPTPPRTCWPLLPPLHLPCTLTYPICPCFPPPAHP